MAHIYTASVYEIITALCRPRTPDRRDGEITLSLGGLRVIICEEFDERELCELAVTATCTAVSHAVRV